MSRVLIVDDKPENLYFLRVLLSAHGHDVDEACHGAEALGKAGHAPPDLIISDLLMPIMDGYTLLRRWKADDRLRPIPFIVYTATYTTAEDERLALDLGADAFVVKPCEPEDFMAIVKEVLARELGPEPRRPTLVSLDDGALVQQYSAALVRKLEEKTLQLEAANRALREQSEERRRLAAMGVATLDALPAHIALLDSEGVIIQVNQSWRAFGQENGLRDKAFAIGENYLHACDRASDGEGPAAAKGIRNLLAGGSEQFILDYPCHSPAERRWFRLIVTPCDVDPNGGALATHLDITETILAQDKSRSDAERLALAVEAAGIGIWEWRAGRPMIWNDHMYALYGLPPGADIDYPTWSAMLHPDDAEAEGAGLERLKQAGGQSKRQFRIKTQAGAERHIASFERAAFDAKGEIERIVGINMDVTEQRSREIAVRAANKRLLTLISEARIGILVHQNFKPIMANDELARMFGYDDKAEILSMPDCRGIFAEHEYDRMFAYNQARLSGGEAPGFYALKGKKKDATLIDLENRAFPIEWDGVASVCAMLTDVTEQRRVEAQLRQAQRLDAIGKMTGGIAHDFNNLLTVILGNAELLERALPDRADLRHLAQMSAQAAEQGAELSNRLLAFSRRQSLDPSVVDVCALIDGLAGLLRRAAGAQVEIKVVHGEDLWLSMIDAAQLESALLNLCVNARDAMPEGGQLLIETANVKWDSEVIAGRNAIEPGDYVLISVADTGVGMDEPTKLRAFDPFFTTKEVGKGSGLGLSMVYGFVKQSQGHVHLYSEQGQGTIIKLYLPRALDGDAAYGRRPQTDEPSEAPRGEEKILVVEDDEMVRAQVAAQLRLLGYEVVSASDGVQALKLLRQIEDFDLLFTDIVMPRGLNGVRLADEATKLYPNLAVLLTSGYTDEALGAELKRFSLLSKPYRRRDLAERVRAVLEQRQARALGSVLPDQERN